LEENNAGQTKESSTEVGRSGQSREQSTKRYEEHAGQGEDEDDPKPADGELQQRLQKIEQNLDTVVQTFQNQQIQQQNQQVVNDLRDEIESNEFLNRYPGLRPHVIKLASFNHANAPRLGIRRHVQQVIGNLQTAVTQEGSAGKKAAQKLEDNVETMTGAGGGSPGMESSSNKEKFSPSDLFKGKIRRSVSERAKMKT